MGKTTRTVVYVHIRTQIVILSTYRNHVCNTAVVSIKNQDAALTSFTDGTTHLKTVITLIEL
jgi:hypothetical protein